MNRRWIVPIAVSALLLSATWAFAQADPRALYDQASEHYRAGRLAEALALFEEFRRQAPEDSKADDALWLIGRIHAREGRLPEAIQAFRGVLDLPRRSNRRAEAGYDLARIHRDQGDLRAALAVLEPLADTRSPDADDRRILRLVARVRTDLGVEAWKAYRSEEARRNLGEAAGMYELLLQEPQDDGERLGLLEDLGKVYARLMKTSLDGKAFHAYRKAAVSAYTQALDLNPQEAKKARLEARRAAVAEPERARLQGRVEGFGRAGSASVTHPAASALWRPGLLAGADLALELPLGWRQQLSLEAAVTHDDFTPKVFNFPAGETGAVRIVQRTDELSAGLAWKAGSRHGLLSELSAAGSYRAAEDPGDNAWKVEAGERLSWRPGPDWQVGLDGAFEWKVYPDYRTAVGRELDRVEAGLSPSLTWYLLPDLSLELAYGFSLRQYLNAVYPPSATDKRYLTHQAGLDLKTSPGRLLRASLGYSFTYNQTQDYTVTVPGNPTPRTISGYYDYLEHGVDTRLRLRWSPAFITELKGGVAFQDFLNYPARDAARTFTGQTRRDTHFNLDGEVKYRLAGIVANPLADVWADVRVELDGNRSNSTYESSVQTNYRTLSLYGGLLLELR